VGSSSADLPLTGTLARLGASCGAGALALNAPDHSSSAAVLPDTPVVTLSNPG
jgi:hypothetical protein